MFVLNMIKPWHTEHFSVQDFNNIQPQDHKFAALGTTGSIGADTGFKIEYTLGTTGRIGADTGFTIEYTLGTTGSIKKRHWPRSFRLR